jgi:hypothetical protein
MRSLQHASLEGEAMSGVRGQRVDAAVMDSFWEQRGAGLAVNRAAAAVGIEVSTARRALEVTGGVRPRVAPRPSGRFLALAEREEIALGWAGGLSKAEIARRLNRHPATIGRELTRNRTFSRRLVPVMRGGVSYVASTAAQGRRERAATEDGEAEG